MRVVRIALALFLILPNRLPATPPLQNSTASPSATTLLQQSLAALAPSITFNDVTLTGSVRRISGSNDETGSVVVQAVAGGSCKIQLQLPSGGRSESRTVADSGPSGSWSGPDGVSHSISYHNLVTDSGLVPLFSLAGFTSNPNSVVTLIGQESRNGQSILHLTASQQFPSLTGDSAALMQHLSQVDIFLDPVSHLPLALAFNTHADDNALLDIPVEIQFSDYRSVNGIQTPFHIQKFLNNSLFLDLQFQNADVNSGLPASTFSIP